MTLEDFKEIHADDSPIRKLDLFLEAMGNWRNDAVNRTDAKWRRNDEEVSYWDNEVKHMMNRSFWLYSELSNVLALQEPRLLAKGPDRHKHITSDELFEVRNVLMVEPRIGRLVNDRKKANELIAMPRGLLNVLLDELSFLIYCEEHPEEVGKDVGGTTDH